MKNYLKVLSRIITPNASKQDGQIDAPHQNISTPVEPHKTKEANVITPNNDNSEWGHAYVLLDVSGSMGAGYESPLYFAVMGVYAFAYDAITKHKYKVGIILFDSNYHVLTHPTSDLMAIAHALDAEEIYKKCGGFTNMSHSFVYACTSLYDMCLKNKSKRKAIIAATDWQTGEYCSYAESDMSRLFMEVSAVCTACSKKALIGLLENFKGFIDTTEFISISLPGTTKTPPPLFFKNHINTIKSEDLTLAIASAAKLLT